ncbi:hypothetical protein M8818_001868 [Zalaria obscura]|uniref:Uncharacterized protein n=1 Tax=Zalaria obscura TaxID=2024903 RepID=A0ACC3SP53_9PEZI
MYLQNALLPLTSLLWATTSQALNITISQPDVAFAPSPLPPSHTQSDGNAFVSLFQSLGRTTVWTLISATPFSGSTWEPEGLIRLGPDRYIVSCGEYTSPTVKYPNSLIIIGTDRSAGAGFAHLVVFSSNGSRIADATLTAPGAVEYHTGGLDYDGEWIWATLAQYRPNSTATVIKIDPSTLESEEVLRYDDHLGGIVHDVDESSVTALNWGGRNATRFRLPGGCSHAPTQSPSPSQSTPRKIKTVRNPSYYVDYQDCKFRGHVAAYQGRAVMLCSGVATIGSTATGTFNLGGIAIVDVETMVPLDEVPITMTSELGVPVTQNPVDVAVVDGKLRLYWLPDQHNSTLYVYEAQPDSPYEY